MEHDARYYDNLQVIQDYDRTLPFYYATAKHLTCAMDEPRWHEEIEIKYILSGTAEIICGNQVFLANQGDVVVINSCEPHGVHPYGSTPLSYHLLMVPPELPILQTGINMPRFCRLIQGDTALNHAIELLFSEVTEKQTAYYFSACGALLLIFSILLRHYTDTTPTLAVEQRQAADRLQPALDYILHHYPKDFSVQTLAQMCNMSVYHFCRVFKVLTGNTPICYINQLRISKAAALLSASQMSIAEIAAAVGIADECYFSRCFKKQIGQSPSTYRKHQHETAK